jgi:hypothetical protein
VPTGETYALAPWWVKFGAGLGVLWAFYFFAIPGWFALRHYRKWKREEISRPTGLMLWGFGFSVLFVLGMFAQASSPSSV